MESSLTVFEGVIVTPLKRIHHPKGDVYHALKSTDDTFTEFGEAYFTTVHKNDVKGWKLHTKMVMNLVVPIGEVIFYFHNEQLSEGVFLTAGENNYVRITVQPGIWVAFQGMTDELNLILNIASIPHDPVEAINIDIDKFPLSNVRME